MNCIYCNRVLISSADDYSNSICCDCKNINLEQNPLLTKIHNLEQENKQLKEQLAEKDKEINKLEEQVNMYKSFVHNYYQQIQNYRNKIYDIDVKKLMSKKLTPEQKEIYYKGFANCERQISLNVADIQIETRKQVCDEIREKLGMNQYNTCENTAFSVYYDYLKEVLDQIEQPKESIENE